MISTILKAIVANLLVDTKAVPFYQGTGKKVNKQINGENDYFIFFERQSGFSSNRKSNGSFDTDHKLFLCFFRHTNTDNAVDVNDVVITKTIDLLEDFIKESNKQGYRIDNIEGHDIIDYRLFDNNVSGLTINLTFEDKNNFNDCYDVTIIPTSYIITFNVLADSLPLEGAVVSVLNQGSTQTSVSGKAYFGDLVAGTYSYIITYDSEILEEGNINIVDANVTHDLSILLLPAIPVAIDATDIENYTFTANWNASARAMGYKLTVATDAEFTNILTGFNLLDVGNVLTYNVNSLDMDKEYFYKLIAYNDRGESEESNIISLETLGDINLAGQWLVDASLLDISGNGNDGVNYGTTIITDAERGQVRDFADLEGTIINCGNDVSLRMGTNDFTLSLWIKTIQTGRCSIIQKRIGTRWYSIRLNYPTTNKIGFETTATLKVASNKVINDGIWHYVTITKSGTTALHYTDGIYTGGGVSNSDVGNDADFLLGNGFQGQLDDVRIYKKALTQTEITAIYNATK